jgi:hypothetical protein
LRESGRCAHGHVTGSPDDDDDDDDSIKVLFQPKAMQDCGEAVLCVVYIHCFL